MLKKRIAYIDFDGTEREEDFYFNLTKTELIKWNFSKEGGLEPLIKKIIDSKDNKELLAMYDELITMAYGIKTDDGKHFKKSSEITDEFKETNAYDQMFIEFLRKPEDFGAFIKGIIPEDVNNLIKEKENSTNS